MNREIIKKLEHKVSEYTHGTLIHHVEETRGGYIVETEQYTLYFDDELQLRDCTFGCKHCR